ncbi:hypothetical protein BDW68DRAFT_178474 [Aspergillus falconensis]
MYTYTPTSKFLVLAPIQSAPLAATNEQTETNFSSVRERSDSSSSTSNNTQLGRGLPVSASEFEHIDALYRGVSHRAGHDIANSEVLGEMF